MLNSLDYFIFHQAKLLLEHTRKSCMSRVSPRGWRAFYFHTYESLNILNMRLIRNTCCKKLFPVNVNALLLHYHYCMLQLGHGFTYSCGRYLICFILGQLYSLAAITTGVTHESKWFIYI